MTFWAVIAGFVALIAHIGLTVFDLVRGRTVIGKVTLYRLISPRHFWATLLFYLAGALFLLLLAVKLDMPPRPLRWAGRRMRFAFYNRAPAIISL